MPQNAHHQARSAEENGLEGKGGMRYSAHMVTHRLSCVFAPAKCPAAWLLAWTYPVEVGAAWGACRLIAKRTVFIGTLNASLVHPREVFADAITDRAASVTAGHNHPSGSPDPSPADQDVTRRSLSAILRGETTATAQLQSAFA